MKTALTVILIVVATFVLWAYCKASGRKEWLTFDEMESEY